MDVAEQSPFCHSLRTDGASANRGFARLILWTWLSRAGVATLWLSRARVATLRTDGASAKQGFREAHTSDVAEQSLFRRSLRTVGTSAEQGYR